MNAPNDLYDYMPDDNDKMGGVERFILWMIIGVILARIF